MSVEPTKQKNKVMDQRAVIKFHAKLGIKATETYRSMRRIYGDDCLSRSKVFEWHKRFAEGRTSIADDERPGRPAKTRTPEMIEKVRQYVNNDPRASLRRMEEALSINKETLRIILHEDLGKRQVKS